MSIMMMVVMIMIIEIITVVVHAVYNILNQDIRTELKENLAFTVYNFYLYRYVY